MENFIKATTGHVRQYYAKNDDGVFVCIAQEFVASDICEYIDGCDNTIEPPEYEYHPYNMIVESEVIK